jgi:hypothetical protein
MLSFRTDEFVPAAASMQPSPVGEHRFLIGNPVGQGEAVEFNPNAAVMRAEALAPIDLSAL